MGRLWGPLVLAGLLVASCAPSAVAPGRHVDLSGLGDDRIELRGSWDWYPGAFLDPSVARPPAGQGVDQPGLLPGARFGTLALAVQTGDRDVTLRLPTPTSAAVFYWKGQRVASVGTPAASALGHKGSPGYRVVTIRGEGDLLVHLSSFELPAPGFNEPVVAGTAAAVDGLRSSVLSGSIFVLTFLVFFAVYHLLMYFFWPRDRAPLFIGLCALLLAVRSLYTGALPILLVWPDLSFESALRMIYLTLFGAVTLWFAYLRVLFPHTLRNAVWTVAMGTFVSLGALTLVLPLGLFLPLASVGLGLALLASLVSLGLVIREASSGDPAASFVAMGGAILACFAFHDFLNEARLINTGYFLPWGMALFLLLQAVSIVRRFSLAFQHVESLSGELRLSILEAERRLRITKVYTRHSLVEIIEKGGDPTAFLPEARKTAVLFCDVRDFTKLTERLDPRQTVRFLNAYFASMNSCVDRHDGEVDKLIGDGIMALFDDPDSALRSALAMRRNLRVLNANPVSGITLDNGIGINYGEVVLGNLGSTSKLDYTVIGDIVNSANRLESLTRHYGAPVLVADDLVRMLRDDHQLRFLDRIVLKGKTVATKIYEAYGHLDDDEVRHRQGSADAEAEAFRLYEAGDFLGAQDIYANLIRERGPAPGLGSACADPVLDFWFNRCHLLETRRQRGLLESWNGIWDFSTK